MFLYLSSVDSVLFFPDNNFWEFTVELPNSLDGERYRVALTSVYCKDLQQDYYYVYCNAIESSVVGDKYGNVLAVFTQSGPVEPLQYHNFAQNSVKRLKFTVESRTLQHLDHTVYFVLHLLEK